jgi:hypothetical protein
MIKEPGMVKLRERSLVKNRLSWGEEKCQDRQGHKRPVIAKLDEWMGARIGQRKGAYIVL